MNTIYLKSFIRCKRKAWLDFKGNKSYEVWSPHKAIDKINQYQIFSELCNGEIYTGLKACERGSQGVIGLKIKGNLFQNFNAEIHPQLLVKTKGTSKWGSYKYLPAVYRLGHKTTKEHLFDLTFSSIILGTYQESKIEKGLIISSFGNKINVEEVYLNKKLIKKVLNVLLSLHESLEGFIPEITQDRKKCTICSWQNFCDKEAKENGYLTDIDGIGSKTATLLKTNGISNTQKLASYNEKELRDKLSIFNEQKYEKASKFIKQAQSYIYGEPYYISKNNDPCDLLKKTASGFYVFDIESNPDYKHDFLYGFLKVTNILQRKEELIYEPILNLKNNKEESYRQIIKMLFSHNEWPVLHYGETEKIAIINIAKNLNFSFEEIDSLTSRFIDLHTLIRKSWILPLKNYGLKTVSNWLGFEWVQKNVSGSKALYWWIQYQITENEIFLKKILQYNKDDCLATLKIAEYLIKNQLKKN
ncbi:TM0106 family RecB-like putative nuclease [Prochlorococcus marinus]|uniref:TM0106 family RecB-like putative nuclease n=1 Tax=Prochlorococcus marinus TaxID=1219 RepID=UPI001ADD3690|nr:TM0106 family RecB-like putative nuclease [Prochlorococcus marinus]MBO8218486.1 TM0106 family RecB-like putative nuclease [Prochlorococcus marinus CUG1416]MBW3050894.1 nuclease [Prochlorococcus marinus str. MU1416]